MDEWADGPRWPSIWTLAIFVALAIGALIGAALTTVVIMLTNQL